MIWFWNRSKVQTGIVGNEFIKFLKAIQNNSSVEQIFLELEKRKLFRLLDDKLQESGDVRRLARENLKY